ncbi:uncharacterized protein [Halyomorpha halys]|uniref:uncharacterized protein n=1 Tax=Halyomorpha halys TaxID=286706 RepID=UPI0006D4D2F8|nr:uncharacterized protein LOC106686581 [Halyomorpha halys]
MLERFAHLKECVVLTLNDLNASHMWNTDEEEYYKVVELLKLLGPIKLAGEALGEECDIQKRDESDIQKPDNVLLKNAMEVAINKYLKEPEEVTCSTQTLRKELLALEATNKRTNNLELYQALKTIKASSAAIMVSDNATIFKSDEFLSYCKERAIFQKFSAPNDPETNGLAERSIQTLKRRLKAAADDLTPLSIKLQNILFRYRATPLTSGQSPAELYLKRRIRIRLDALHPNTKPVWFRPPRMLGGFVLFKWGRESRKLGKCHYIVVLDSGRSLKRHIHQLLSSLVSKKSVTFPPPFYLPRRLVVPTTAEPSESDATRNFSGADCQHDTEEPDADGPPEPNQPESPPVRRSSRQRAPPRYLSD